MSSPKGFIEMAADLFVPIHREGHRFIAIAAIATLALFLIAGPLGWIGALATIAVAAMFRDPDRVVPLRDGLVVSPADGKVIAIEDVVPSAELALGHATRTRIAIGLSLFDVHVTRSPIAGVLARSLYVPGAFLNPTLDKASESNERRVSVLRPERGDEIAVVHIAGVLTRRIIALAEDGAPIGIGDRLGLIRFGSRVDIYLPPQHGALVAVGQTMIGGETVIADLRTSEPGREARRK